MLRPSGDYSAEQVAAVWLTQAHRLLASADLPTHLTTVRSTRDGPLITLKLPTGTSPETTNAILEWALEAAARVLRGNPQPSDAEVYKAARALLS